MPEYLTPAVYVEETSFRSRSIEGVPTSTFASGRATPISLKPRLSAPQPPGVCSPAMRSSSAWRPSTIGRSSSV